MGKGRGGARALAALLPLACLLAVAHGEQRVVSRMYARIQRGAAQD
jgi:hypothetical protein